MNISRAQLAEALHLVNQMLHDSLETWVDRHFTTWRSFR